MSREPVLILQMQRMGDLVLSFPLLGWLAATCPEHPLWMVGESEFFEPLLEISPNAVYFSYDMAPNLEKTSFKSVINLSHRPEAASLAARARCACRLGPWLDKNGNLRIDGDWQLYRSSLTQNNRFNLYHWADLNALDCVPEATMQRTLWPKPRPLTNLGRGGARIGLFIGASQPEKHPDAAFWAALVKLLLHLGHKPVLLGGQNETALGRATAALVRIPAINLCGRFNVGGLARFIDQLDLLITPDTGPMHIAAWLGTPVINLSLGPVSASETGPCPPGHHVLRADLDCVGCWQCHKKSQICRKMMTPEGVAAAIEYIAAQSRPGLASPQVFAQNPAPAFDGSTARNRLELLRTARDKHGLYALQSLNAQKAAPPRRLLSDFWQAWFGAAFCKMQPEETVRAFERLADRQPAAADALRQDLAAFFLVFTRALRAGAKDTAEPGGFWQKTPEMAKPFAGYAQMLLQNGDGSKEARARALSMAEDLMAKTGCNVR